MTGKPVIGITMCLDVHFGAPHYMIRENYFSRLADAGAVPILIPPEKDMRRTIADVLTLLDGIVFIGGRDYPPSLYGEEPGPMTDLSRLRPEADLMLMKSALSAGLPILGICGGCQLLSIASGGKLIQHLENAEAHTGGKYHQAECTAAGRFAEIFSFQPGDCFTVNSFHHQAIDPKFPGQGLSITATAFDGSIEVIERTGHPMTTGVQFHPERMDDLAPLLFSSFAAEAEKFSETKGQTENIRKGGVTP